MFHVKHSSPRARSSGPPLSPEAFQAATDVSRETLDRLRLYADRLVTWSRAVNLVGRDTLPDIWRRHFLDSAQLAPLLPPAPEARPRVLIDLGSGAGFPGLVLAILGAGAVHLVEADTRKAAFLREVARETETAIVLHTARIEGLAPFAVDAVTARALAPLPRLLALAAPFLTGGATALFLKGRSLEGELTDAAKSWMMTTDLIASRTDADGRILRLTHLAPKESAS